MNDNSRISLQFYAKLAGFTYLFIIIIALLNTGFVDQKLIIPGDDAATAGNILSNDFLFRTGNAAILIMYASVVVLAWALYILLKPANKNIALLALIFRVAEAVLGCVTILTGFIVLDLLSSEGISATFTPEQVQALIGMMLNLRLVGLDIVLIFVGLGGSLYCYLFYMTKYVPRILAVWGIYTYLSMIILALFSIIVPDHPVILDTIFYGPGGLFELIFGFWLLIKGVRQE